MTYRNALTRLCVLAAAGAAFAIPASAEVTRHVQVIDAQGARIEVQSSPADLFAPYTTEGPRAGDVWHFNDPAGIIQSCCLADTAGDTWLGVNLNFERLLYLETAGDGTPLFEYDVEGADSVAVASAEDVSLGVMLLKTGGKLYLVGFTPAGGDTPIWTYTFDAPYVSASQFGVDVSADGSLVMASGLSGGSGDPCMLVQINGLTGDIIDETVLSAGSYGVDLSDDGSRAALTLGATTAVVDTATLTELHSFAVSGTGGVARISGNGMVATAGGFNLGAYRDTGSGWELAYTEQESTQWYGGGLALSDDGETLFGTSRNYTSSQLHLRIIDLVSGSELARLTTTPTGSYQDVIVRAEVGADGTLFAIGTWGQETNPHDEVMVLDRDANVIAGINMPGSCFDIDFTENGRYLVASGKHVHANVTGNGGDAYVYELDVADCPEDLDGNGSIGQEDLGILLASYGVDAGGDIDGDGDTDQADLGQLLAVYGTDC
jgi:hypothetical protein